MKDYSVYLVKCSDNSYYTGIAIDVEKRVAMHNTGVGAKYTRARRPVEFLAATAPMPHREALQLERKIKKLRRRDKLTAILNTYNEEEG